MRPLSELAPMTTACFCSNTLTPRCSGRSQKPLDNKADLVYVSFSEEVIAPLLVNQPPPRYASGEALDAFWQGCCISIVQSGERILVSLNDPCGLPLRFHPRQV